MALIGANGSVAIHIDDDDLRPAARAPGRILFNGKDITSHAAASRLRSYVLRSRRKAVASFPRMTVLGKPPDGREPSIISNISMKT